MSATEGRLREAAMILSDLLSFALANRPEGASLKTCERDAMVWIEDQVAQDSRTQINHWTGCHMRTLGFLKR